MTSSSDFVAKAQLSAYQRWELASLAEVSDGAEHAFAERPNKDRAQAIADAKDAAQKEGYAAGYAQGIAAANDLRARLEALLASVAEAGGEQRQEILDGILDFALLLARHIVGETVAARREVVLPIVAEALRQLPVLSQNAEVLLHPSDVERVRAFLAAEPTPFDCMLKADAAIGAGGCRIVTAQGEIDATLPTRWRRLLANLGCADEWLESA